MNRFQKRKLKNDLYKHGNFIIYGVIFLLASVITVAAAFNRTEDILYVDDSALVAKSTEAINIEDSDNEVVAASTSDEVETETAIEPETEVVVTTEAQVETTEETTAEETTEASNGNRIRITADSINVRSDASTSAEAIGSAMNGDEFDIIYFGEEWVVIDYNGTQAYVSAEFVERI